MRGATGRIRLWRGMSLLYDACSPGGNRRGGWEIAPECVGNMEGKWEIGGSEVGNDMIQHF